MKNKSTQVQLRTMDENTEILTDKQKKIYESAIQLISEKGYNGVSTHEIATLAGVSEGTIFKQYKTKKNLFLNIIKPLITHVMLPLNVNRIKEITSKEYTSFKEFAEALITERMDFAYNNSKILKIIFQEFLLHEEIRLQLKKEFLNNIWPNINSMIVKFQKKGELKNIPSKSIARSMISIFFSYIFVRIVLFPEEEWNDKKEIQYSLDILMKGIE